MNISDILVIGLDLVLFSYFAQIGLNTTNMTVRIVACFAMTAEVFFIRQHLKMNKLQTKNEEEKKST